MADGLPGLWRAIAATPWAILPEKLEAMLDVVALRASGTRLTADEITARLEAAGRTPARPLARAGKVAVLPLSGVIAQRMNLVTEASGGTSTELFGKQFAALVDDPEVAAIVLDVDSPGGSVQGVPELAAQIHAARGTKPIVAVANSLMASAAYWIASAADEVVAAPTAEVGSIGVFMVHTDRSGADAQAGLTRTVIRAGAHKAEGNPYEPLSDDARAHLQSQVDDMYGAFTADVARHRGTTADAVRSGYGQGRTLIGARAVEAGLADRVATLDQVLAEFAGTSVRPLSRARAETPALPMAATDPLPVAPEPTPDAVAAAVLPSPSLTAPAARSVPVSETTTAATNGAATTPIQVEVRDRGREIMDLCALAGVSLDRAREFAASNKSMDDVRAELFREKQARASQPATPPAPSIENYRERGYTYSIGRAVLAAATNDWREAGYEREVSQDLERKIKGGELRGVRGTTFYMPTLQPLSAAEREARMQAASHVVGTASAGGNLVFTEYGGFIDLLRTRLTTMALGATMYPGLQGNVAFPRQTGAGEAYWVAEGLGGTDVTESNQTFDQVSLSPKTVMARQRYSNQLLAQGVVNIDAKIRNDLAAVLARKVDKAALHGSGVSNEPAGLYTITGVNEVTFGGGITFSKIVDMEAAIEADDADIGVMAYLTTPEIKGKAKTKQEFTSEGVPIWRGSAAAGEMNGYRAMASNQVSKTLANGTETNAHGIIFGVWSSLLIGDWGGIAVTVDPYTLAGIDQVRIISRYFVDVDVDHPEAFCRGLTLTNT